MNGEARPAAAGTERAHENAPRIELSKSGITRLLVIAVIALHVLNIPAVAFRYVWPVEWARHYIMLFGVSSEGKLPTFYSGLTMLGAALLLGLNAAHARMRGERFRWHWIGLAVIFTLMAMDEMVSLHELSSRPIREALGITGGALYHAWVIPAAVFLAFMGVAYLRFLVALPARSRMQFVLAGVVYVGGALGMELIDTMYASAYGRNLIYGLLATLEEVLEMAGILLFLYALMDHMERCAPESRIRVVK